MLVPSVLAFGEPHDSEDKNDIDKPDDEKIGRQVVPEDGKDRPGKEHHTEGEYEVPDITPHRPVTKLPWD